MGILYPIGDLKYPIGDNYPIGDWGYMSLVTQSQRTNHQSPTLLHEPRELSHLPRAMKVVLALKHSEYTGLYCWAKGVQCTVPGMCFLNKSPENSTTNNS